MSIVTHTVTIEAKNRGEVERHRRAVSTLLSELARDPRTQRLFATLHKQLGLNRATAALRRMVARGATRPMLARIEGALIETLQRSRAPLMDAMADHVVDIFRRHQLQLASGLLTIFLGEVAQRAHGKATLRQSSVTFNAPAPQLLISLPPEQTPRERKRLVLHALAECERVMRQTPDILPRPGRQPKKGTIERDAIWYYRHVAQGMSVSQLGKEYCKTVDAHISGDGHEIVCQGIEKIARLLNLPLPHRNN